jgi:hypothetical protein
VGLGVIRKPLAPAEIRFSIAWTWDSLSPSFFPANVCSLTFCAVAACCAPCFILTKKGFVSVLVISPTTGVSPLPEPPPQAATMPRTRIAMLPPATTLPVRDMT